MRLIPVSALLVVAVLMAAQTAPKQKAKPKPSKPAAEEPYDPAKLRPGEIACGRELPGEPDACKCMTHRMKMSEEAQAECEKISDKTERAKCMVSNEACAMMPITRDSPGYDYSMPAQCKRWCTKARCECCKS